MQLPQPANETARLENLRSYRILDTPREQAFDDLARLAAFICGTPIALISLIDTNRQWFKSAVGWDVTEIPRSVSFCAHTILKHDLLVIPETLKDETLAKSPLATHGGIRFYAGMPLITAEGFAVGTLCVMDCVPRGLTEEQTDSLQRLACQVVAQLELRQMAARVAFSRNGFADWHEREGADAILGQAGTLCRTLTETASDAIIVIDQHSNIQLVNQATEKIFGYPKEELLGQKITILMPDCLRRGQHLVIQQSVETAGGKRVSREDMELRGLHKNGKEIWLQISFSEFDCDGKHLCSGICRDITGRKQAEKDRFQFAAIVESCDDAIVGRDLDGIITSWNRGAEKIYGYSAEEVIGEAVSILNSTEHPDETRLIMEKLKRSETIGHYQALRVIKSGKRILVSLTVSPIRDETGRIVGASSVERDITEHKRVAEKLRNEETPLRLLVERMPVALWATDSKLRITFSAGAGLAALDWHPDQMINRSLLEYFQTDDPQSPTLVAHLRALRGEPVSCEIAWSGRTFEARVEPLRDAEERIVGCVGIALHAPAQKQGEVAWRASEARYRSLFEGVVHGIYRVSVDGQFFEVNPALAAMLGYDSPDEVVKLNAASLHADQEERVRMVQKWIETKRIEDEVNWNRRNGEMIRVRLSGRTLTDQQGVVQGFEFIAEDVTERRALEAQLRQAQKIEAVGQLGTGLAHEFNNFLGIILGYSELMSEEAGENERLCRQIAEIKGATQRAASLTRQLLAFGRKQLLEPKVLDLNSAIWETQKLLHRLLPANIDVVPVLSSRIGQVKVDPGQVQQILINLVVNARDAMPKGGKVVIETSNAELDGVYASQHVGMLPGAYVMLSVSDTGQGMDNETSSHIFEPFFTTKAPGKGTGLGLSTVYGIVKQSGGNITVETAVGKGTTFYIYLPLVQAAVEGVHGIPPSPTEPSGAETILVVEDEATLRRLLCLSLERRGYKVYSARDGAEAMEIFRQKPGAIHLVVSDIIMPHMDGIKLKQEAAALRPDTKFLFMSGYSEEVIEQLQTLGQGCAFLEKPFLPKDLVAKVQGLLRGESDTRTDLAVTKTA
jgi:two-component system, cell cycle sensor histidine kinase and response regulator CckA